jgi:hypothetical protein
MGTMGAQGFTVAACLLKPVKQEGDGDKNHTDSRVCVARLQGRRAVPMLCADMFQVCANMCQRRLDPHV